MYPAPASTPSPDATPVPIGRRIACRWACFGAASAALAVLGAVLTVLAAVDMARPGRGPFMSFGRSAFLLLFCGTLAFVCLRMAERHRHLAISTDFAGLWITERDAGAVIAWNDVAAIGLHEYALTGSSSRFFKSWSIELRLHEPLEPGDPLLDSFVLPADPPRYMIRLPHGTRIDAMAAVRARVPELWQEAPDAD
ncbi:hypothetical protein [Glycomyces tritici]|uniref:PH domain-containing protein n=1 Tax=Glycomyces tritici TaxID=2665176 RepID=A0ABT7YQG3_9ACTN|nr:hypothetical protein [Glycomyces tritici]MDN3240826.1 hypothetical protein [Glycomyces tritici]